MVLTGTKDQAERTIHFDDYKIWIKHPNDPLIKFKNIDSQARKCSILKKPETLGDLSSIAGLDDINPKCCWSYKSKQSETLVCTNTVIRCVRDKKMMLKHIIDRC